MVIWIGQAVSSATARLTGRASSHNGPAAREPRSLGLSQLTLVARESQSTGVAHADGRRHASPKAGRAVGTSLSIGGPLPLRRRFRLRREGRGRAVRPRLGSAHRRACRKNRRRSQVAGRTGWGRRAACCASPPLGTPSDLAGRRWLLRGELAAVQARGVPPSPVVRASGLPEAQGEGRPTQSTPRSRTAAASAPRGRSRWGCGWRRSRSSASPDRF